MIALLLSFVNDLRDARKLARTVRVQDEQIDALTTLAADLEAALEVAETAAEEYRARVEAMTAPRDAATTESRVLSTVEAWRADRERDTAARLNAAEVELARLTAAERACHEALSAAGVPFLRDMTVEGRIGFLVGQRRHAEQGWSQASAEVGKLGRDIVEARARIEGLTFGLEAAVERARRWERRRSRCRGGGSRAGGGLRARSRLSPARHARHPLSRARRRTRNGDGTRAGRSRLMVESVDKSNSPAAAW